MAERNEILIYFYDNVCSFFISSFLAVTSTFIYKAAQHSLPSTFLNGKVNAYSFLLPDACLQNTIKI